MTTSQIDSPVRIVAEDSPDQPAPTPELLELYLRRLQEDLPEPQAARHA